MAVKEKFVLKWENFSPTVTSSFQDIRKESSLFDLNLLVGARQVSAHRLVVSACSPVLREIIKQINNSHSSHPVIFLKGVRYEILLSILDFMYQGEVSVTQEDLSPFLDLADELQVRGLTQDPVEKQKQNKTSETKSAKSTRNISQPLNISSQVQNRSQTVTKPSQAAVSNQKHPATKPVQAADATAASPTTGSVHSTSPNRLIHCFPPEVGGVVIAGGDGSDTNDDEPEEIDVETSTTCSEPEKNKAQERRASSSEIKKRQASTSTSQIVAQRSRSSPRNARARPCYADESPDEDCQTTPVKRPGPAESEGYNPKRKRQQPVRYTDSEFVYGDEKSEAGSSNTFDSGDEASGSSRKDSSTGGLNKRDPRGDSESSCDDDDVKAEEISITDDLQDAGDIDEEIRETKEKSSISTEEEDAEVLATLSEALEDITRNLIFQVPDKSWKCLECNQLFYHKLPCQNHVEAEHLQSETHVCPVCIQKFPTIKAVREHVMSGHKKAGQPLDDTVGAGHQVEEGDLVDLSAEESNRTGEQDDLIEIEQEIPVINL